VIERNDDSENFCKGTHGITGGKGKVGFEELKGTPAINPDWGFDRQ